MSRIIISFRISHRSQSSSEVWLRRVLRTHRGERGFSHARGIFRSKEEKKKKEDRLSRFRFMPSRVWILVRPLARDQIQVLGFFLPPISRRKRPNIRKRDKATSNELPKTRNKKTRRILTLISRARSHKTHSYFLSAVVKKNPLDKSNIDRTLQARHFDIRVIVYVTVDERASWKSPRSVDTRSFDRD